MASCQDLDRLLTPYLDGESGAEDRRAVDQHLGACPPCARRAAAEGTARRVVMVRARTLVPTAPDGLRRRCRALAHGTGRLRARRGWVGWRALGLAVATLVVVGLAATIAVGVAAHSPALLVAELTLDHLKCFALFEPTSAAPDARVVAARLESDYGWRLAIPSSLPRERLTLMGARRCFSTDGRVAHVLYRHDGRPLSLFVMRRTAREPARGALAGHVARIWSRGDATYVLLAGESDGQVEPVATYFRAGVAR